MGGTRVRPDEVTMAYNMRTNGYSTAEIARRLGRGYSTTCKIFAGAKPTIKQTEFAGTLTPNRETMTREVLKLTCDADTKVKILQSIYQ